MEWYCAGLWKSVAEAEQLQLKFMPRVSTSAPFRLIVTTESLYALSNRMIPAALPNTPIHVRCRLSDG
jgi:hypothetical protein